MPGVFLSYRRDDSAGLARSVYESLCRRFGPKQVFLDVEVFAAGTRLPLKIRRAVASSDVVVVLAGRQWLEVRDENAGRRLDDPEDYVHQEIAMALDLEIPLVVVLLDDLRPLDPDDLPPKLAPLADLESCRIRHESFRHDVGRLAECLLTYTKPRRLRSLLQQVARPLGDSTTLAAGVALIVFLTAMALHLFSVRPRDRTITTLLRTQEEYSAALQDRHVKRNQGLLLLNGRVEDDDGRPIPNATVSVTNIRNERSYVQRSRSTGEYIVDLTKIDARLDQDVIDVAVTASGFSAHEEVFKLTEDQTRIYRLRKQ